MSWERIKLENCCEITSSKRIFFSEYAEKGIPFYRSKEIIEKSKGSELSEPLYISKERYEEIKNKSGVPKAGDMLLTSVGTIGIPYIIQESDEFYFKDGNLTWFRSFNDSILPRFLYYWIKSAEGYGTLYNATIGSSQKALTILTLKGIEVPCPPADVQQRIIDILSSYDDLIENKQKQIKLLEEAAQRLYKEWFVDLRFPGYEDVNIVDGVPEGWHKTAVTDLIDVKYGKDHKKLEDGNIPVYGSGGIMRKVKTVLYSGESVLIPRKGSLNNIMYVSGDFWTIDTMFFSVPKMENIAKYTYHFLKGLDMYSYNIGAAVPSMTIKILSGITVLCPTEDILQDFENLLSPIYCKITNLQNSIELLVQARDRLLPKLMSGEIEV